MKIFFKITKKIILLLNEHKWKLTKIKFFYFNNNSRYLSDVYMLSIFPHHIIAFTYDGLVVYSC